MLNRRPLFCGLFTAAASLIFFGDYTSAQEQIFTDQLFPPEFIAQHRAELQLSEEQQQKIKKIISELSPKVSESQKNANAYGQELAELLQTEPGDEARAIEQLRSYLAAEHKKQQSHFTALLRVRNVLTQKQRTQLTAKRKALQHAQARKATDAPNETEVRLRAKVDQIRKEVESRASRGIPSDEIGKLMQQFSANMQKGQVEDGEAVLDRAMKTLNIVFRANAPSQPAPQSRAMLPQPPAVLGRLQQAPKLSVTELNKAVNYLHVDDVAWRKIDWETSLTNGLKRSRAESKPLILWVFIDRPIDDERC